MAFFGLTALGPQNSFANASRFFQNLYIFDESDFEASWNRVVGAARFTKLGNLRAIMEDLFHGPVPANDQELIDDAFCLGMDNENESLSLEDYLIVMKKLREETKKEEIASRNKSKQSCEFSSSVEFKESFRRHRRMEKDLREKQIQPLTTTHEVSASLLLLECDYSSGLSDCCFICVLTLVWMGEAGVAKAGGRT